MRCYIVSFRSFPEYDIFKYDTDYMCLRVVFFQAYDKSSVLKRPTIRAVNPVIVARLGITLTTYQYFTECGHLSGTYHIQCK